VPKVFHANPVENNPYPSHNSPRQHHQRTIIPTHPQCFIPPHNLPSTPQSTKAGKHRQFWDSTFPVPTLRIGRKLHSQIPKTPPIPTTKTIHVHPNNTYPHQTVSRSPSRSRNFTIRRQLSSSKKEDELILLEGDLRCGWASSEEDPVVVVLGGSGEGRVPFGAGTVSWRVEERWRRERVLLRLRRERSSREGIMERAW